MKKSSKDAKKSWVSLKQKKKKNASNNNITKVYHKPVKTGDAVDKKTNWIQN